MDTLFSVSFAHSNHIECPLLLKIQPLKYSSGILLLVKHNLSLSGEDMYSLMAVFIHALVSE